jgi:hypothetical protein
MKMILNLVKDRSTIMRMGMACLLLGNLLHYFIRPAGQLGQDVVDGGFGLLLGLAIALLVLSLRRTGPHCSSHEA